MKKLFTSMFAMATLLTASAQMASGVQARVYAYNLQQDQTTLDDGVNTYTITFQTNCAASEGAKVCLLNEEGETVYEVAATAIDDTQKSWSATVDVYVLQEKGYTPEAGDYNWSVEVSAPAVTSWKTISDHTNYADNFTFFRSFGIAIDNNPENDAFGTCYVVNQKTGTGYTKGVGIFTCNPDLVVDATAHSCDALVAEGEASSGTVPSDMSIGADGRLYLSNYTATAPGVYVVDPKDNYASQNIFVGTVDTTNGIITNDDGETVCNKVAAVGVYGADEDREIFALEYSATNLWSVNRYKIGAEIAWNSAPSFTQNTFLSTDGTTKIQLVNVNSAIEPIAEGYWVTCYRSPSSTANPFVAFINNDNEVKFNYDSYFNANINSRNGAIAVDEKTKTVAVSANTSVVVFQYTIAEDGSVTASNSNTYSITSNHQRPSDMAFDYAGNLYCITAYKETLSVWSVPTDNNTCTTPAKSNLLVSLTENDITTGIVEVGVDADAAVEYYNLQGVKVANPSNGVFIKKQGNKTTKVVL